MVVLPTPPFWLAMAMVLTHIILPPVGAGLPRHHVRATRCRSRQPPLQKHFHFCKANFTLKLISATPAVEPRAR